MFRFGEMRGRYFINRDIDPCIVTQLDIRSLIRLSWTNEYFRGLAKLELQKLYLRIDPWIWDKEDVFKTLWEMSKDVYFPKRPFAFYIDADKRKHEREVEDWTDNTGKLVTFHGGGDMHIRCIVISHTNTGKLTRMTYYDGVKRIDRFHAFDVESIHRIVKRWYDLFPNERNTSINSLSARKKRRKK